MYLGRYRTIESGSNLMKLNSQCNCHIISTIFHQKCSIQMSYNQVKNSICQANMVDNVLVTRVADPDPVGSGAGSGKFSKDLDPIGTLAMLSCINK